MKKAKETPDTSKKTTQSAKRYTESYRDMWTGSVWHKREDEIEGLGLKLIQWLKDNPKAIRIEQWCEAYGIPRISYYKFRDKFPKLAEYHENAKMLLANRREEGMVYLSKGMRERPLMFVQGRYCPGWRKEEKIHAEIKTEIAQQQNSQISVIEIEKVEDTDEVRQKMEADERRNKNKAGSF